MTRPLNTDSKTESLRQLLSIAYDQAYNDGRHKIKDPTYKECWLDGFEDDLVPLFEYVIGEDRVGIRKASEEHIKGTVCLNCGCPYLGELGGCLCPIESDLRYEQRQRLAEVMGKQSTEEGHD